MTYFVVGDKRREVLIRPRGDGLVVLLDGRPFAFRLEQSTPGRFVVWRGDRHEVFDCVRDGEHVELFWRGVVYRLLEEREGAGAPQRTGAGGLEAPMPGRVIKVNVVPGQAVVRGEEVLVIEAMKMENVIRAPKDGTVRVVAARVGDLVGPGLVLVELE